MTYEQETLWLAGLLEGGSSMRHHHHHGPKIKPTLLTETNRYSITDPPVN